MTALHIDGIVAAQTRLSADIWQVDIICPEIASIAQPGQFVTIRVNGLHVPLLRRPFGVSGVNKDEGKFSLIYRIVGEATQLLGLLPVGQRINLLGPLGHGFTLDAKKALLVGGGVGLAPLHFLAERAPLHTLDVLIGGRSAAEVFWEVLFKNNTQNQYVTTDDGSYGTKGTVNALLPQLLAAGTYDRVYVCGPSPMMKAVAAVVEQYNIPCQVSLEKYMGCGLGACLSCSCAGRNGKRMKICKDGPVFDSREVTEW